VERQQQRTVAAQVVAREVINSRKAINRLHLQKAHFFDMECALKEQLGAEGWSGSHLHLLPCWLTVRACVHSDGQGGRHAEQEQRGDARG